MASGARERKMVSKGVANEPVARAALLGTQKRPVFRLSELFEEYVGWSGTS